MDIESRLIAVHAHCQIQCPAFSLARRCVGFVSTRRYNAPRASHFSILLAPFEHYKVEFHMLEIFLVRFGYIPSRFPFAWVARRVAFLWATVLDSQCHAR